MQKKLNLQFKLKKRSTEKNAEKIQASKTIPKAIESDDESNEIRRQLQKDHFSTNLGQLLRPKS